LEARHRVLSAPDGLNERAAVASEMVSLADRLEHRALQLQSRLLYLNDLLEVGDAIAARAELDTFARLAGESRVPLHAWHLLNLQVTQTLVSGDFPSAERLAARALALGESAEIETARHLFFALMFGVRREQGRLEEILEALRDLAQRYPSMLGWRCVLAYAYSELGRRALARTEFERLAARDFDELPRDATWLSSVAFLAHVCAFLRDQGRAQTLRRLLAPFAGQNVVVVGTGLYSGPVSLYLGMLAVVLNDTSDALAQFAEALDAAMRMGARPFVGRVHLERARALLTRRRRLDLISARDDLRKAAAIFEELGMTVHLERARALLARSQADTASFVVYPDRLTAREAEVLRLIADGRTNREIAETLTLSVRTVGRHITNIYGKIGARNRAEATAYALRHGFVVLGDAS
jgi:DNA-binding CsgD family transcriptional regulator